MEPQGERPPEQPAPPGNASPTLTDLRDTVDAAIGAAEAALGLVRAELRLARSSALNLIWLGFGLVFLGVGAWLATSAAIAAGIYQLTGNVFIGIAAVALANGGGIVWVLFAMRHCWRDLTLPRTRRMLDEARREVQA